MSSNYKQIVLSLNVIYCCTKFETKAESEAIKVDLKIDENDYFSVFTHTNMSSMHIHRLSLVK